MHAGSNICRMGGLCLHCLRDEAVMLRRGMSGLPAVVCNDLHTMRVALHDGSAMVAATDLVGAMCSLRAGVLRLCPRQRFGLGSLVVARWGCALPEPVVLSTHDREGAARHLAGSRSRIPRRSVLPWVARSTFAAEAEIAHRDRGGRAGLDRKQRP